MVLFYDITEQTDFSEGPVATEGHMENSKEVLATMSSWNKNTPLAAVREDSDRKEFITYAEISGGRPAYESEIAALVALLCSPDAAWTTGSVLCANGGMKFTC